MNLLVEAYLESSPYRELQQQHPNIEVAPRLRADLPPVAGSAPHLTQVLTNLFNNAFEAMPHGGRVTIQTMFERIDEREGTYGTVPAGDFVTLRIADQGAGISPADLERIFEPFYTRNEMGRSGTGLGLPVVYGVVKDLHGHIDVTTCPGHGSEFVLYFPALTAPAPQRCEQDVDDLRGTETILVVDDMPEQRAVTSTLLGNLGYHVATVEDGPAAIAYTKQHPVDLVVLDMVMEEEFDGLDTYRGILDVRPDQRCILVSGFSESNRVRKTQALGAGAYVRKPFTRATLGRAVREELSRPARVRATERLLRSP
jgi:CheY-like chemotaxis protein